MNMYCYCTNFEHRPNGELTALYTFDMPFGIVWYCQDCMYCIYREWFAPHNNLEDDLGIKIRDLERPER
jgi:hypothetical protein